MPYQVTAWSTHEKRCASFFFSEDSTPRLVYVRKAAASVILISAKNLVDTGYIVRTKNAL